MSKNYQDPQKQWWKESVVYQVYPRSFMDSNGDGIGDLQGLISKLDYLKDLGIDVIWICPMFKSPQDDNGYDISDYQDIHHEFGSMADFDKLLDEVHQRGMKLILDLVVNHTSDEHPWFIESRSSRTNPKRNWYIWRDPKNDKEPNNWESIFGGSAWKYDEATQQYFMHLFSKKQPDLNWENTDMRQAIYQMVRWWLDKGIDGFRLDAISHMKKKDGLPDLPNPQGKEFVDSMPYHMNVPGVLEYLSDLCKNTFAHYDIMTVGEANGVKAENSAEWVASENKRMNMIIQFEHMHLWNSDPDSRLDLEQLKNIFTRWQTQLDGSGWNALFVENHDIPRITSKWGDVSHHWKESAKAIATMYFLMQGTPFIYQGQEIGMTNCPFNSLSEFRDVFAKNHIQARRHEGISDEEILQELNSTSRDHSRTPFQWSNSPEGGFTGGTPWIKVNLNYKEINAESQINDPESIWSFYRSLIRLRREHTTFIYGSYEVLDLPHKQVYTYLRKDNDGQYLVISNLSRREAHVNLGKERVEVSSERLLLSNYKVPDHVDLSEFHLKPYEARVYKI